MRVIYYYNYSSGTWVFMTALLLNHIPGLHGDGDGGNARSVAFVEMASRTMLQVSRHVLRGSRCLPITLMSRLSAPSVRIISAQNNRPLFHMTRQSASFLHTSAAVSSSNIVTIQDEKDFDARVLQNEKPVLVDFFATYVTFILVAVSSCHAMSCRMLYITNGNTLSSGSTIPRY